MNLKADVVVVGGGAAGYFAAIHVAIFFPEKKVVILEKSGNVLSKVKISGGGRCNVTHSCFVPRELIAFYPRGSREMQGPFNRFQPGDVFAWFEERGVQLKTEEDGRVFPVSNSSQSIIDCFQKEIERLGIKVILNAGITSLHYEEEKWLLDISGDRKLKTRDVIMTAGSSAQIGEMISRLGHTIVPPVPSLFTFNIKDPRILELSGVVAPLALVEVESASLKEQGPLLITHWGMSGPAILKLSAWGARFFADKKYNFTIKVNWDANYNVKEAAIYFKQLREEQPKRFILSQSMAGIPNRLWNALLNPFISVDMKWADASNKMIDQMAEALCASRFMVSGKSTFKEEFVTAGGVSLKEIDFTTMSSKIVPHLFFAGEVLDIDAVTGGFNFQAAWTTAWIAAHLSEK